MKSDKPKTTFDAPTSWRPRGSQLLLVPCVSEERSSGGIIIPDAAQKKLSSGYIAIMGPDVNQNTSPRDWLHLGDEAFFEAHSETRIKLDDNEEHAYLVAEESILLVKPTNVTSQSRFARYDHIVRHPAHGVVSTIRVDTEDSQDAIRQYESNEFDRLGLYIPEGYPQPNITSQPVGPLEVDVEKFLKS